ncbi:hypothetical protein EDC30_104280 [Paucimonas lemoignei]|uniref:GpW protein n=1 Tax=Paucimonas lemoignei TaxID=29443 RepID=A0A4R3HW30_PAULE|nr:DUF6148 family protein [Paucimonas lemoignei]TCS37476.1 hypothetical protein EDC30_104280 [Paucimonas lemoignei]
MAGITLQQAQAQLDAWMAASTAVATGQEYSIGTRKLRRADAAEIRQQIIFWQRQVAQLGATSRGGPRGMRVSYGVPR